jgi:type IX secretion system PorP/SprF family membrane protein
MRLTILFFIILPAFLFSQQLPDRSAFTEMAFVWNPAMTAAYDYWEVSANYRQQWLGFDNAPRTAVIAAQYPFEKANMSIGGYFMHDRIQPLNVSTIALTYAYKFEPGLADYDRAIIGAAVNGSQYLVDALEIVVNDPDDALVPLGESTDMSFNAGVGFFYTSYAGTRRRSYDSKSSFFFGVAANQVFPSDLVVKEGNRFANWKRAIHGNALIGARLVNDRFFIEPSAWVNYSTQNNLNANVNVKMEMPESFWTAVTYSTNQTLALQVGLITKGGFSRSDFWRIGALGSYNVGNFGNYRGVGFEVNVAYRFGL